LLSPTPGTRYTNLTSTKELFEEKFELWNGMRQWEDLTVGPVGWASQVPQFEPESRNPKPETRTPNPETPAPKLETLSMYAPTL
jgi:hypothetical protein